MTDPYAEAKRAAARQAVDRVESGMRLGLGTGSTFRHALERLSERIREEKLECVGVPTSEATATHARQLGVPLTTLDELDQLDLTIDGADEVDHSLNLVKGGGGALLREKIVAAASREVTIIVSDNKLVEHLGTTFRLPVEVLKFGWRQAAERVRELGLDPVRRGADDGSPFDTDSGNYILDCGSPAIEDPAGLEQSLLGIPGVVDCGLFVGMTRRVLVGDADGGVREITS